MSMTRYRCYQGKAGCDNPVSSAGQTCAECVAAIGGARLSIDVRSYLTQLADASKKELRLHEQLKEAGWVWDAETRRYTHPQAPGAEILLG